MGHHHGSLQKSVDFVREIGEARRADDVRVHQAVHTARVRMDGPARVHEGGERRHLRTGLETQNGDLADAIALLRPQARGLDVHDGEGRVAHRPVQVRHDAIIHPAGGGARTRGVDPATGTGLVLSSR